jgi:hypothetical protein
VSPNNEDRQAAAAAAATADAAAEDAAAEDAVTPAADAAENVSFAVPVDKRDVGGGGGGGAAADAKANLA